MMLAKPVRRLLKSLVPSQLRPWMLDQYLWMLGQFFAIRAEITCQMVRRRKEPFVLNGETFRYFSHHYNRTYYNERAVEIPIALSYLDRHRGGRILEVGNVMGHYTSVPHVVVDKFEIAEGVLDVDIIDFVPSEKYDLVLSISTFEHIGYDESTYANDRGSSDDRRNLLLAVENAKRILAPNGVFLLTAPMGFNSFLDEQIASGGLGMTDMWFLKRVSGGNRWKQVPFGEALGIRYATPFCPGANGVVVAQYVHPS